MRRLAVFAIVACLCAASVGCSPSVRRGAKNADASGPIDAANVSDADFGPNAYQVLLSDDHGAPRAGLLVGVVRRQLSRAAHRFNGNRRGEGLKALTGAFYLVRTGELRPEMFQGGAPALRAGAAEVSRVGDEGRSLALYSMLRGVLPPGAERTDVDSHLHALSQWTRKSPSQGPMQSAGALQRAAINRALIEPSKKNLDRARDSTVAWMKRALEFNTAEMASGGNFEREEAIEAYRAVRAGGATLVALYLRFGDPKGALGALEKGDLMRVVPPGLVERLEHAADDDDPAAWFDLYRLYSGNEAGEHPETSLDADLARAAAWGAAVELFRAEPRSLRGAGPLATQLIDFGMAEVAPLVVGPALGENPSAQDLSWALSMVLRAVVSEDDIGEHAAARRTFDGAQPILALAEGKKLVGKVRPTAARLHYVMGALETRADDLARAKPHVEAATKAEPTIESLSLLAAIDRQKGDSKAALATLDRVIALARKSGDYTSEAEALTSQFEIHRDKGNVGDAKTALDAGLGRALKARELARSGAEQARAERVLARVLEHFGAAQGAKRATERAYEASRADSRQLTATLLDASRRALTSGDLPTARTAVRQAVDAGLSDEDLVYVALWLRLLEIKNNVPSDGTVEEAFATIDEDSGWPARLSAWARKRITDDQLIRAARTRSQQIEAKFYIAMSHRVKGEADADRQLREVAASESIELVEVTIARDLLAQQSPLAMKLPDGVSVP